MPRYRTTYEIHSKTYIELMNVAWHLLDSAEHAKEGRLLNLQACAVFCAFAFEAYLNHVGEEEINNWAEIERFSHTDKLKTLAEHLRFNPNKGQRPFQTITSLFKLRDNLAHGRTQKATYVRTTDAPPPRGEAWRQLPWEQLSFEGVKRCYDDVNAAINAINAARKIPDDDVMHQEPRSCQSTRVEPTRRA
ncbi:hypothetical protein ANRL4_02042 [Anaerolineae bacterium]|nr:hypothetical protein ANRL4_02042 [Anaerolineae bacterium]